MTMKKQLNISYKPPSGVFDLKYSPADHGIGIVHFGPGAFHRAHQAVYTDAALEIDGGDWRILGVSLQSTETVDALNDQDGQYSLLIKHASGKIDLKVVGSIAKAVAASRGTDKLFATLASPSTHIVSMTVTEKAYGIDRATGRVDVAHPAISHDLAHPHQPIGILGLIVKGLQLRKDKGHPPFTVLCCDNLPNNGDLVRAGVLDLAGHMDESLKNWIAENGCFPNSMVDRITPAATQELLHKASDILEAEDKLAIETEPFSQWVIEDQFCGPRPKWEKAGVIFVKDVTAYEQMKLRMLNGTHSLIAYIGHLNGCKYVRDAMENKFIAEFVRLHILAAAKTLPPLDGIDLSEYGAQLIERFKNPNIAHETYQIAMDGTQKLPQRIFEPAIESLQKGLALDSFALAFAAWAQYCFEGVSGNHPYDLRDPRQKEICDILKPLGKNAEAVYHALCQMADLVPTQLSNDEQWQQLVVDNLEYLLKHDLAQIAQQTTNH